MMPLTFVQNEKLAHDSTTRGFYFFSLGCTLRYSTDTASVYFPNIQATSKGYLHTPALTKIAPLGKYLSIFLRASFPFKFAVTLAINPYSTTPTAESVSFGTFVAQSNWTNHVVDISQFSQGDAQISANYVGIRLIGGDSTYGWQQGTVDIALISFTNSSEPHKTVPALPVTKMWNNFNAIGE